jgi:hypothetical protein
MPKETDEELVRRLRAVRAAALDHARVARQLARERRTIIETLVRRGWSQADVARELDVSRQAIQKMLSL